MKLVTFSTNSSAVAWTPGLLHGENVFDLNAVLRASGFEQGLPFDSVRQFLQVYGGDLPAMAAAIDAQFAVSAVVPVGARSDLHLGSPVNDPSKVLCIGLNYAFHVSETGRALPSHPDVFSKFASSIIGADDTIDCSDVSEKLDYEGELAVVIGKHCRRVSEQNALEYVAGLTVLNDVSARDLQHRGTQWLPGKAIDGSTPCGPALVTLDEVGDPQSLDLRTLVNGVEVQNSNTKNMIFSVAAIVAYISGFLALAPGDIIATGTPEGIGAKRHPPLWLHPGDTVEVDIPRVGNLRNTVK